MMLKLTNTERVIEKLCKDMPRTKPCAVCIAGRLVVGRQSAHRTRQGQALRKFSIMKTRVATV